MKAYRELMALYQAIAAIREEQVSDSLFGGTAPKEKALNSQLYAATILGNAGRIDELLEKVEEAQKDDAPDLLEAAKQILDDSAAAETDGDWEHLNHNDHWDNLREAIAHAEGDATREGAGA